MNFLHYKDNKFFWIIKIYFIFCAQGESRTRTSLQTADFESAGSTIPPLGHIIENKRISVVTFLKSHRDDIPHHQDVRN